MMDQMGRMQAWRTVRPWEEYAQPAWHIFVTYQVTTLPPTVKPELKKASAVLRACTCSIETN